MLATRSPFALCDPETLTFDLILIVGRGLVMDYTCANICDFSFSRFGFIVRTDTHSERITDTSKCFTPATVVGMSNEYLMCDQKLAGSLVYLRT